MWRPEWLWRGGHSGTGPFEEGCAGPAINEMIELAKEAPTCARAIVAKT